MEQQSEILIMSTVCCRGILYNLSHTTAKGLIGVSPLLPPLGQYWGYIALLYVMCFVIVRDVSVVELT